MPKTLSILVLLLASLFALPSQAQQDVAADTDARAQFDAGRAAYAEGRFEDAVTAFRRAYVLSPRYQLLYNIGQAELRAGHDARALGAFEGFLRQAPPDDERHSEVQERVRVLHAMGVTEESVTTTPEGASGIAAAETTTTQTAPTAAAGDVGPAPWIIVGVGGAAVIAGAVMMGVGASEAQRVTNAPMDSRWPDLRGSAENANVLWGVGIGVAAVGLVAVAAGVGWAIVGHGERSGTTQARIGLGSVTIEGEF